MTPLSVIILAAGKGKRMVSDLPKVLHPLGGRPLLSHVLDAAAALEAAESIVVYGHGGEAVRTAFPERPAIIWIEQPEQLGTGHAVEQALPAVPDDRIVLVLYGDVPLIQSRTLAPLVESAGGDQVSLLTVELDEPTGYGRIVRDAGGRIRRIVEEKDTTPEERRIREVNTGILAAPAARLRAWIETLENANSQGEYYLTDVIERAVDERVPVQAFTATDPQEILGVNDRVQLARVERCYQRRQAQALMLNGATVLDPDRLDVRGRVTTGRDVVIDVDVVFEGEVRLGDRVRIGPYCLIRDAVLGDDSEVLSHCRIEQVQVGREVQIGPFARLRPGTRLADRAKIGNFVEVKKSTIGRDSKVNHLTYIGDSELGVEVNVGAGTITCNYDGAHKHRTVIEDRVFIGSNTALVAPVRIGAGATIGAGSTITKDIPPDSLGLTRAPQKVLADWPRPTKKT